MKMVSNAYVLLETGVLSVSGPGGEGVVYFGILFESKRKQISICIITGNHTRCLFVLDNIGSHGNSLGPEAQQQWKFKNYLKKKKTGESNNCFYFNLWELYL